MMKRRDFRYLVLWLFLSGIIVIVFLQVISGYNTKRLIEGNRTLLDELQVQNDLRKLETGLLTTESDIRGAVITGNPIHLQDVKTNGEQLDEDLLHIRRTLGHSINDSAIRELDALVKAKTNFNQQILSVFNTQEKNGS